VFFPLGAFLFPLGVFIGGGVVFLLSVAGCWMLPQKMKDLLQIDGGFKDS